MKNIKKTPLYQSFCVDQDTSFNYFQSIINFKKLSKIEEKTLFFKWKINGCLFSRNKLIKSNLINVYFLVKKFHKSSKTSFIDLIQDCNESLIEALNNFNPSKGRLANFASFYIKNKILRRTMQDASIISIPESEGKRIAFNKLRKAKRDLKIFGELTELDIIKLKKILNISRADILLMEERFRGDFLLNNKVSTDEENNEWIDLLEDKCSDKFISIEDEKINKIDNDNFKNNIILDFNHFKSSKLNKIEKIVAEYRILNSKKYSLNETGIAIGKSAERVRQLEIIIKEKFKKNFPNYLKIAS